MIIGHGECQSMSQYASTAPRREQVFQYDTAWDGEKIFGCNCDIGYTGSLWNNYLDSAVVNAASMTGTDCSIKLCPSWLDPRILQSSVDNSKPMDDQSIRAVYNHVKLIHCKAGWGSFRLSIQGLRVDHLPFPHSIDLPQDLRPGSWIVKQSLDKDKLIIGV